MNRLRNFRLGGQILAAILACLNAAHAPAATGRESTSAPGAADPAGGEELAAQLEAEVREIAGSNLISRAKKERRISTVVRVAVVTATSYQKNPTDALALAIELTQSAVRAAPAFTEVVVNAASFAPVISRLDGASGKIRTAALAASKSPGKGKSVRPSQAATVPARSTRSGRPVAAATRPTAAPALTTRRSAVSPDETDEAPLAHPVMVATTLGPSLGNSSNLSVSATIGARHDDNIFLAASKEVSDTVFTVTPGLLWRYGQDSLARGSLGYNESFLWYAGNSAPRVSLGAGAADFSYDGGSLSATASASFQQLNQNSNATATPGSQVYRRDVLDLALNLEAPLTTKTRIRTGASSNQLKYKTAGLVGTRQTEIPLTFFLETTPKTSVGLGTTYRTVTPQGDGPSGHDLYYNVAARGAFTQKLSGEFSVGYRSREVAANPRENLWGFDGSLNYAATGKSNLSLRVSRDFSTGPLGESITGNRYALRLATDPTLQWSFGAALSYQTSDYGPAVFNPSSLPVTVGRQDDYWEGSLFTSYTFTSWLTGSADYSLRKNQSSRPDDTYTSNQFNLVLGLRY